MVSPYHGTARSNKIQKPAQPDARRRVATPENAIPMVFVPLKAETINTR
jgi:hypothetical protein